MSIREWIGRKWGSFVDHGPRAVAKRVAGRHVSCAECGKQLAAGNDVPYSPVLGGYVCSGCAPPEALASWVDLAHLLEHSLRFSRSFLANPDAHPLYRRLTNPNIDRLRSAGLSVPVRDLISLWRAGYVHSSLTSLTHEGEGEPFKVIWSDNPHDGVEYHDNFARNFNEGIKYPNIRMSGLADFEHLLSVGRTREGNAFFARSIAEVLIVAMHAAHQWNLHKDDVRFFLMGSLSELIRENGGNSEAFEKSWVSESLDDVFDDMAAAISTDVLELRRFIRGGELFLLCLERWV